MKKMTMGIAVAAVVVLLGTPAMATAAPTDYTTNPHGRTNGSEVDRYAKTNGAITNPFKANGDTTNPFTANGAVTNPFTSTN